MHNEYNTWVVRFAHHRTASMQCSVTSMAAWISAYNILCCHLKVIRPSADGMTRGPIIEKQSPQNSEAHSFYDIMQDLHWLWYHPSIMAAVRFFRPNRPLGSSVQYHLTCKLCFAFPTSKALSQLWTADDDIWRQIIGYWLHLTLCCPYVVHTSKRNIPRRLHVLGVLGVIRTPPLFPGEVRGECRTRVWVRREQKANRNQ